MVLQRNWHLSLILWNLKWPHKEFVPSLSIVTDYYQVTKTVPILDHLMSDLELRFSGNGLTVCHGFIYSICHVCNTKYTEEGIYCFCQHLLWRSAINQLSWFRDECFHWENLSTTTDLPNSVVVTLKMAPCNTSNHYLWVWEVFSIYEAWSRSTMESHCLNRIAIISLCTYIALQYIYWRKISYQSTKLLIRLQKGGRRRDLKECV